jgi:hypothetical protein
MKGIGLVIILIFGACCSTGHAQNPDTLWTMKLPGPGWQKNQLFHLIPTPDNNYVAAGVYFTDETQEDVWAVKFNADGEFIWNKTYCTDQSQPWLVESTRGLTELSTGELVIFAANQDYMHYLIFPDMEGNLSRLSNYMTSEDPYYIYAGTATEDDNLLVAGENSVNVDNAWVHYSWYRKMDSSGNVIWERSLPPVRWQDTFNCIGKLSDGGFILAGVSDTPDNYDDILLVRIDAQGDTLWTRRRGTAAFDHPEEVVPTQDGGFILAATKSYMSSYKGFLLKLDANGNEQWMQTYNDYDQDQIHSVSPTLDGGYIIAGEHIPSNSTISNFWVMKTDQQGRRIKSFELGNGSDFFRGRRILQSDDGSYIAVGHTSVDGLIIRFSPFFGALGLEETINISGFSISHNIPNPFRASTVISWKSRMPGHAVIRVFDFTGREIMVLADENQRSGEHKVVFDAMGLAAGIYFYQLNVNGVVESGKMILTE